ncbi:inorganic triphosphatase [Catenovulum sp. SM1970]|uniref:CYTH domain-containing protein n=1 Tax=Marinifaba aquimaris TaxID=2741323 RepID=UPI0015718AEC|nr:CYTH domain-containing protein [Marinifaba aquimaris]NTS77187.1 inorganic triphosphatase [Marinifaba aquimaris]
MDTEIELKFFISKQADISNEDIQSQLNTLLTDLCTEPANKKHLVNSYFDTKTQTLRSFDFGLRVRAVDGHIEQTIKTAGSVVGGLHKRPEYNIDIQQMRPELGLFPQHIWPQDTDLDELAQELIPLFTTTFDRHKWLCLFQQSTIEVVLDLGEIDAGKDTVEIREIELELVDGDVRHLCELAEQLSAKLPLRLSNDSKAARGYRLFTEKAMKNKESLGAVPLTLEDSVEAAFIKTIQHGLSYWQYHEEVYVNSGKLSSLTEMAKGLWLVKHGLWLYRFAIPEAATGQIWQGLELILAQFEWLEDEERLKRLVSKKGSFSKKLSNFAKFRKYLSSLRVTKDKEAELLTFMHSKTYSSFIIRLVKWLYERSWRCHSEVDEKLLNSAVIERSGQFQENSWDKVRELMPERIEMSALDYMQAKSKLGRSLLTGNCVGRLYPDSEWQDFRSPWLDIIHGIEELGAFGILYKAMLDYKDEDTQALQEWCKNKSENLVFAMEQSRKSAYKLEAYW